jgi:DNA polymerase
MVSSDLANIEGRFLAWLAGEEWKLQAFRAFDAGTGPDLYYVGASEVLNIPIDQVTADQRQAQGKVPELACGYQGAVGAFQAMARIYGLEMSDARALEIVKAWRKKNKHIVELWYETERAAIRAAEQPGLRVEAAGGKLVFQRDGSWLRMRLPSGRCLCYPGVAVEEGKLTYMGTNQYSRRWERLHTYGGKLIENATQGGARDVLAHNMAEAEAAGYEIVLTCHDELVTETLDSGQFTAERLSAIMSTVPPWATGLPLAASGWEGPRYRK